MTHTYTLASLPITRAAYQEIRAALKERAPDQDREVDVGYDETPGLDMHGICLLPHDVPPFDEERTSFEVFDAIRRATSAAYEDGGCRHPQMFQAIHEAIHKAELASR